MWEDCPLLVPELGLAKSQENYLEVKDVPKISYKCLLCGVCQLQWTQF